MCVDHRLKELAVAGTRVQLMDALLASDLRDIKQLLILNREMIRLYR